MSGIESELQSYKIENDRLANELLVGRRLSYEAGLSKPGMRVVPVRMPDRQGSDGALFFALDRCEKGTKVLELAGWIYSPQVHLGQRRIIVCIESDKCSFFAEVPSFVRADVSEHLIKGGIITTAMPSPDKVRCGFSALVDISALPHSASYDISIVLEGIDCSFVQRNVAKIQLS